MPVFHFRALDSSGEVVEGQRESPDKASLARRLRDEGYMPLKLDTGMVRREPAGWRLFRRRGRMMTADGLALFTRQLATLIGADLPADRALATIAQSGDASATSTAAQAGRACDASLSCGPQATSVTRPGRLVAVRAARPGRRLCGMC